MITIDETIAFVRERHAGQTDRGGKPYLDHVMRVFWRTQARLKQVPASILTHEEALDVAHAALLHDVVEDTQTSLDDLRERGYGEGVIARVARLTGRLEGVTYMQNIENMVFEGDLGVIAIKLSDNEDNSEPERIAQLSEAERGVLRRYERSKDILQKAFVYLLAKNV
jgi:(p)ppGpp synthase/HD superfamily hydrolase